jgi:hypothetical protein
VAQDSAMSQPSPAPQSTTARQDNAPAAQPADTVTGLADTSSPSPSSINQSGKYGSGGYGHRAEVFVTGFGLFANHTNGNAIAEQVTNAGGASAGYRFHLNSSSALEGRYGFSRNSEKYTIGGAVSSIPSYFSEISGSYVYSFAKSHRLQPFLEGGGGVVLFSPGNYATPTNSTNNGSTSGGTPFGSASGYAVMTLHADDAVAPIYSGSSAGIGRQARGMFLYGVGADIPALSHMYFRTEFRGLGYKAPDFGLSALQTNAFSFAFEPSVGFVYRF